MDGLRLKNLSLCYFRHYCKKDRLRSFFDVSFSYFENKKELMKALLQDANYLHYPICIRNIAVHALINGTQTKD